MPPIPAASASPSLPELCCSFLFKGTRLFALLAVFTLTGCSSTKTALSTPDQWVGTWGTSPQLVEPGNMPPEPGLEGNTLRQIIRVSLGGSALRARFSNEFGTDPLTLKAVHLASSLGGSAIDPGTDTQLTFNGKPDITIMPGTAV